MVGLLRLRRKLVRPLGKELVHAWHHEGERLEALRLTLLTRIDFSPDLADEAKKPIVLDRRDEVFASRWVAHFKRDTHE